MSEQALLPVEEKTVLFYEDEITAVVVERDNRREIYVPLRPICDYLGVDWSAQRQRINRDPVLSKYVSGVVITPTPLSKYTNPQEMVCLRLDYLNGWLFGINASRVKEEVRDRLLRYQEECYRILADAFLMPGTAIQPVDSRDEVLSQLHNMALVIADTTREMIQARHLAETGVQLAQTNTQRLDRAATVVSNLTRRVTVIEQQIRAGKLTEEQAAEIKRRVNAIANEMAKHEPGKSHYQAIYAALGDEVGVTSYKNIPLKGYDTATNFLDNWLLALKQTEGD
jgi:hypothetical protein